MPFVAVVHDLPAAQVHPHRAPPQHQRADDDRPRHWTQQGPWWQLPLRWATVDLWYLVFYLRRAPRAARAARRSPTVGCFVAVVGAALAWSATASGTARCGRVTSFRQRLGMAVLAWWFDYLPHHGLTRHPARGQVPGDPGPGRRRGLADAAVRLPELPPGASPAPERAVLPLRPGLAAQRAGLPRPQRRHLHLVRPLADAERVPDLAAAHRRVGATPDRAGAQRPVFHPLRVRVGRAADRRQRGWSRSTCRPISRTSTATSRASTSRCAPSSTAPRCAAATRSSSRSRPARCGSP